MKLWNAFFEMFKSSAILQALLTILLWGVTCYLFIQKEPIPQLLEYGDLLTIGYWFGVKSAQMAANIRAGNAT